MAVSVFLTSFVSVWRAVIRFSPRVAVSVPMAVTFA